MTETVLRGSAEFVPARSDWARSLQTGAPVSLGELGLLITTAEPNGRRLRFLYADLRKWIPADEPAAWLFAPDVASVVRYTEVSGELRAAGQRSLPCTLWHLADWPDEATPLGAAGADTIRPVPPALFSRMMLQLSERLACRPDGPPMGVDLAPEAIWADTRRVLVLNPGAFRRADGAGPGPAHYGADLDAIAVKHLTAWANHLPAAEALLGRLAPEGRRSLAEVFAAAREGRFLFDPDALALAARLGALAGVAGEDLPWAVPDQTLDPNTRVDLAAELEAVSRAIARANAPRPAHPAGGIDLLEELVPRLQSERGELLARLARAWLVVAWVHKRRRAEERAVSDAVAAATALRVERDEARKEVERLAAESDRRARAESDLEAARDEVKKIRRQLGARAAQATGAKTTNDRLTGRLEAQRARVQEADARAERAVREAERGRVAAGALAAAVERAARVGVAARAVAWALDVALAALVVVVVGRALGAESVARARFPAAASADFAVWAAAGILWVRSWFGGVGAAILGQSAVERRNGRPAPPSFARRFRVGAAHYLPVLVACGLPIGLPAEFAGWDVVFGTVTGPAGLVAHLGLAAATCWLALLGLSALNSSSRADPLFAAATLPEALFGLGHQRYRLDSAIAAASRSASPGSHSKGRNP